jgi:hypothetical protein
LSKLSKLRGNAAPVAVFSNNADASMTALFDRMQTGKPSVKKTFEKKVFQPQRLWLKKGETSQVVILDEKLSFGRREHSVKQADGHFAPEPCIADHEPCPLCEMTDTPMIYDVILLSCLDLREYTNKEGKVVKYTKKVIPIKKNDLPAYIGLAQVHGSLRGLLLNVTRGEGEKSSAIGAPTYVASLDENDLLDEFGHEARVSDKGVIIVPENDSINPWNYDKFYKNPSRSDLMTKYRIAPRPGSKEEAKEDDTTPPWNVEEVDVLDLGEELPELPEVD